MRDLAGARTVGVIAEDRARGLIEIARPVGVVAAITPSTNPGATPANNIINALKCRNAIVLAPSPKGASTLALLLTFVHAELDRIGAPRDLVLALPIAVDARAHARADAPGRPGRGHRLAQQRTRGLRERHARARGWRGQCRGDRRRDRRHRRCRAQDRAIQDLRSRDELLVREQRHRGRGDRGSAGRSARDAKAACCSTRDEIPPPGAGHVPAKATRTPNSLPSPRRRLQRSPALAARSFRGALPRRGGAGIGREHPFSGEKLSPVLALYRARDFDAAAGLAERLLRYQGAGHSVGLHSRNAERAVELGLTLPVCRVIVNQAHCFATGGSYDNALPFSLSMGCGTWGGNSFSDNLNYRHFLNITRVVHPLARRARADRGRALRRLSQAARRVMSAARSRPFATRSRPTPRGPRCAVRAGARSGRGADLRTARRELATRLRPRWKTWESRRATSSASCCPTACRR